MFIFALCIININVRWFIMSNILCIPFYALFRSFTCHHHHHHPLEYQWWGLHLHLLYHLLVHNAQWSVSPLYYYCCFWHLMNFPEKHTPLKTQIIRTELKFVGTSWRTCAIGNPAGLHTLRHIQRLVFVPLLLPFSASMQATNLQVSFSVSNWPGGERQCWSMPWF